MYNILACDDEQIVIDSLCFIFNKNFNNELQVFTANSGNEALQIVNTENIDIIFMDINMPGLTGLEALSKVMEVRPDTVVVMLSAFDKFQYAQSALNQGAFKYITKPVNRNLVIETVRDAMKLVDKKRGSMKSEGEFQKKMDIFSPMVENDFIYSCVFSKNRETEDLKPFLQYFSVSGMKHLFSVIELAGASKQQLDILQNHIRSFCNPSDRMIVSAFMVNRLVLFYSTPEENENVILERIGELYNKLCLKSYRNLRMGVSFLCDDEGNFSEVYSSALVALNYSQKNGGIEFASESDRDNLSSGDRDDDFYSRENLDSIKERLFSRMKLGDGEGVLYLAGLYSKNYVQQKGTNLDYLGFDSMEILVNARNLAKEALPGESSIPEISDAFSVFKTASTFEEIASFLERKLYDLTLFIRNNRHEKENPVVKKACDYINSHLSEDFSLEEAAAAVGVSQFYLSKLFREVTGQTFVNYIGGQRLERARSLILETDFSIKEISAMCGYKDQNYFSKMFKGKFGLSPTELR